MGVFEVVHSINTTYPSQERNRNMWALCGLMIMLICVENVQPFCDLKLSNLTRTDNEFLSGKRMYFSWSTRIFVFLWLFFSQLSSLFWNQLNNVCTTALQYYFCYNLLSWTFWGLFYLLSTNMDFFLHPWLMMLYKVITYFLQIKKI